MTSRCTYHLFDSTNSILRAHAASNTCHFILSCGDNLLVHSSSTVNQWVTITQQSVTLRSTFTHKPLLRSARWRNLKSSAQLPCTLPVYSFSGYTPPFNILLQLRRLLQNTFMPQHLAAAQEGYRMSIRAAKQCKTSAQLNIH